MQQWDEININQLEVFANHGVFAEEQSLGQKFLISCSLYGDYSKAGHLDQLEASVNYAEVCTFITHFMKDHSFRLIEACAENLCHDLLIAFPLIDHISLELKKPWAPIGLPLETVSVKLNRGWHTAYIALGSNIGDRLAHFSYATNALASLPECTVQKISDYITTPPYGPVKQEDFLNGCIQIRTLLPPEELLALLHKIEQERGRTREIHWGPRTLDLDILLYDDIILHSDDLTIPHPEMHKREFVLKPLAQISPYTMHPIYRETIASLMEKIR